MAGSGTTAQAIINLNRDGGKRKYILIELANYFDTVLLPRVKKAIYSYKWKGGKPTYQKGTSNMVKYQYLEQYEDALNNLELIDPKSGQVALERFGDEYLLHYMLNFETRGSPSLLDVDQFKNPFDYKLKVADEDQIKSYTIDLVETFNYLLGIHIKKVKQTTKNNRIYRILLGEENGKQTVIIWRSVKEIESSKEALIQDREFIEKTLIPSITKTKIDHIFINSPCIVEKAEAIEPKFKGLMFPGE